MVDVQELIYDVYAGSLNALVGDETIEEAFSIISNSGQAYHPEALDIIIDDLERNLVGQLKRFKAQGRNRIDSLTTSIVNQAAYDIDLYILAKNIVDEVRDQMDDMDDMDDPV